MIVAIATSERFRNLPVDEIILQRAFTRRGIRTEAAVWDDVRVDWAAFDAVLIRSTWDYHAKSASFRAWIERISKITKLVNAPALVLWNLHKSYLLDLQARGVDIIATKHLPHGTSVELRKLAEEMRSSELVIKPAISASGHDLLVFAEGFAEADAASRHLERLLHDGDVLVQPFCREIFDRGERSLIFFGGHYSHAVTRPPLSRGAAGGETRERLLAPSAAEVNAAKAALAALDETPAYARVDLLSLERGTIAVMELELIEPALFFGLFEGSAEAMAAAVSERIAREKVS